MAYTKQTWLDRVGTFLNRFTKSNETLSSVELVNNPSTITQAGTAFSASRMNYMEAGIENAHRIATPLSDLSRVMRINGDGVPMFPDNVAGTYQKYVGFTSSPLYISGVTAIVENGALKLTITTTGNWFAVFPDIAAYNSALLQIEYSATPARPMKLVSGGITWTQIASQQTTGSRQILTGYTSVQNIHLELNTTGWSVGDVVYIYSEYIGSGLYDTPVYGKVGQAIATNYGALPVNGPRGKGLRFQRGQFIELDHQIGSNGCVHFIYDRSSTGINEYIFSDNDFNTSTGKGIFISDGQQLFFAYGNGSTTIVIPLVYNVIADGIHSYVVNFTPTTIGPVFRDGVLVQGQSALTGSIIPSTQLTRIGAGSSVYGGADRLYGDLADIGFRLSPMTQDDAIRYHNGDDAVDSQQKSVTPVPHSIVTRDANGGINASNMFAYDLVIDSDAKLSAWAASGNWEKVLIKKGTWTLASGGVDLVARGTKLVIGEPESKLVFSSATNGLYYTSTPTTKDYRMDGVTVETTGTGFSGCTNMTNCTGTGAGSGTSAGFGFYGCTNMTNCTGSGTGVGAGTGAGFGGCTNMTNCTGSGAGSGTSFGFVSCKKCQQNTATGSTAKYNASYADSASAYACADTPNGGFNS